MPRKLTYLLPLLLALPVRAQTTGNLSGQVFDATNQAPVPDAVVIATSPAMQGEQTVLTDAQGSFEITLLPPGSYRLIVQSDRFNTFQQDGLQVRLDKTLRLKLSLQPSAIEGTTVIIDTFAKPVISATTETGTSIDSKKMELIPMGSPSAGRGFEQTLTSVPRVHADGVGVQMAGSGGAEHQFIVDGVAVNDPAVGTQGTTLLQDFIQEIDVKTGGYQAEYGRSTGGIVNVVTKSGGNDFHGSVFLNWSPFEAARRQVANPGEAIASQRSQKFSLDFGAEAGGPILRDKLWFYAGFAPQIIAQNRDRIIQARTDDGTGHAAIDPQTGAPIVREVARQSYDATSTSYQFTGKLTYLLNENHTLALAVYGNPTTNTGAQGGTVVGNDGQLLFDTTAGSTDVSLRYSGKLFDKSMLVEATAAYHHQFGGGQALATQFTNVGNVSAAAMRDTPSITWLGQYNLLSPYLNSDPTTPAYQKSDAVRAGCAITSAGFDPCPVSNYLTGGVGYVSQSTLDRVGGVLKLSNFVDLAGHHQFKYGIDAAQDRYDQTKFYTGGAQFLALQSNGVPTSYLGVRGFGHADPSHPGQPAFDPNRPGHLAGDEIATNTKNTSIAAFAQDSWNLFDKLLLDVGVRAEKQLMYADPNTLDAAGNKVTSAGINLTNVMPRVGVVYDFTGRGLSRVYASYGRFYEYVPLDLADRSLSGETQATYTTNAQACVNAQDPRFSSCTLTPGGQPGGRTYSFTGGAAGSAVDPNLQGQYADEYQGGVQYQFYRDVSVGVDYTHKSIGRVIEDMSVDDGNTFFLSNPGETGKQGYAGTTSGGTTIREPLPRRVYDGVTLSLNKNFNENWLMSASYTYSQLRGNYPGLFTATTGQLDPNNLSTYDLLSLLPNQDGPLPGDIPNAFKVDGAYVMELDSKTTLSLGGNLRAQEGTPQDYLGAHPLYGPGEAFVLPRGSAGRLPWLWSLNLRGSAAYKISKDYSVALNVDLFNVTDNREVVARDENYTFDNVSPIVNGKVADLAYLKNTAGAPVAVNPNFLAATAYQLPFSARVGAKLSF